MSRSSDHLKSLQWFLLLGGIPFLIFGIVAFRQISEWRETWKTRKAMVESGALTSLEATVAKKWENRSGGKNSSTDYLVSLRVPGKKKTVNEELISRRMWNGVKVGESVTAYQVDGEYFTPPGSISAVMVAGA